MPAAIAARGDPSRIGSPVDLDRAAVERLRAVDRLGGLAPARTRAGRRARRPRPRATSTETSSRTWRRVRSGRPQHRLGILVDVSWLAEPRPGPRDLGHARGRASCETSSRRRDLRDRAGVDPPPVAKDGHRVAQPEDLVEPVRDVDDRHAVAPQEVDHLDQPLDLARLERRGRLVHDHDAVVGVDTARAMATICWTPRPSSRSGRRTSTSMP